MQILKSGHSDCERANLFQLKLEQVDDFARVQAQNSYKIESQFVYLCICTLNNTQITCSTC